MLNGVKNKKLFEAFSAEFFLFSQGVIHFALRFTYSLDFFGSFLDQACPDFYSGPALIYNLLRACSEAQQLRGKNEQVEIWITTGESDFVSIVAEKKKQQYRQNRIVQIVLTKASQPWLQK